MIDLGAPTEIGAIRVYNRVDGSEEQQTPLEVQISDDNEHFETIATRHRVFTQAWPWTIHCSDIKARYVRFMVVKDTKDTGMCLTEVELFASPVMAEVP